jgi:transposase-like protein
MDTVASQFRNIGAAINLANQVANRALLLAYLLLRRIAGCRARLSKMTSPAATTRERKLKIHGYDSRVEGLMQKKAPVEKPTYAIGDRVEKLCAVCNEERGHVVASITKRGSISRVTCPKCGTKSSFSSGTKLTGSRSKSVQSEPYDMARTYRTGQVMIHPLWGPGEVTAIIEPRKIDVLFADRIRRLIHSRADL